MFDYLLNALTTLFVTVDPPGLAPIFVAVTAGASREERAKIAWRAVVVAAATLIFFGLTGEWLIKLLGITLPAFRIAGGLLLFFIAFEMVFARRSERKSENLGRPRTPEEIQNLAVFPIAIPLISGPGAISATILTASQAPSWVASLALVVLIAAVMASCLAVFLLADPIDKALGTTGRVVIERLLGLVLAALAVQFVADGVKAIAATA